MATITAGGIEFFFQDQGDGPPVLFVHGMCGDAGVWEAQMERLSSGLRCISYDRRGHSRTPLGDVTQRTVEVHADDAAALVDAIGVAPCHVVGSSGGARVAFAALRRHPRLFRTYRTYRPHQALGWKTPQAYLAEYTAAATPA